MKIQNAFRVGLIGTLGVGLGILILSAIVSLSTILTYIGAALFLALGLEPIIAFLERRKLPRWSAIIVVLVGVIVILGGIIWAMVPVIISQGTGLVKTITEFVEKGTAQDWYAALKHQFFDHIPTAGRMPPFQPGHGKSAVIGQGHAAPPFYAARR